MYAVVGAVLLLIVVEELFVCGRGFCCAIPFCVFVALLLSFLWLLLVSWYDGVHGADAGALEVNHLCIQANNALCVALYIVHSLSRERYSACIRVCT